MPSVMTANRLATGEVVYLTNDGRWVTCLDDARAAEKDGERSELEAVASRDAASNIVVGPYLFDVRIEAGAPQPLSMREAIRAGRRPTFSTRSCS